MHISLDRSIWIRNNSTASSHKFRFHQYGFANDPSSMEDNADMNEIEEELTTVERDRNPKIVLGFFSIIILIAAIVLGVTLSDSNDSSNNSVANQTSPAQSQVISGEEDSIEIEVDENVALSPLEKGKVTILGDPIPVDPEIGYLAPSFEAELNDGSGLVTVNPADGTVRLIGFFAHWCLSLIHISEPTRPS